MKRVRKYIVMLVLLYSMSGHGQRYIKFSHVFHPTKMEALYEGYFQLQLIPNKLPNQEVDSIRFSKQPSEYKNIEGMQYARWNIEDIVIGEPITTDTYVKIYHYDLALAKKKSSPDIDSMAYELYTKDEKHYQTWRRKIKRQAKKLRDTSRLATVENIFDFVKGHLAYKIFENQNRSAILAFDQKEGDCTEYSELMIALCRSLKIPARIVSGYTLSKTSSPGFHNWVEVYFDDLGWVPFDPTLADHQSNTTFDNMQNIYIYSNESRTMHKWVNWYRGNDNRTFEYHVNCWVSNLQYIKYRKARILYDKNELIESEKLFDELILETPIYSSYHRFKGMIRARKGDFESAQKNLQFAMKTAYTKADKQQSFYTLGNYYALINKKEMAISHIAKSIDLGFKNYEAMKNDIDLINIKDTPEFNALLDKIKPD